MMTVADLGRAGVEASSQIHVRQTHEQTLIVESGLSAGCLS